MSECRHINGRVERRTGSMSPWALSTLGRRGDKYGANVRVRCACGKIKSGWHDEEWKARTAFRQNQEDTHEDIEAVGETVPEFLARIGQEAGDIDPDPPTIPAPVSDAR